MPRPEEPAQTSAPLAESAVGGGEFRLQAGDRVGAGRFRLERLIGRGGMGTVWLASDERLKEPVALKFVSERIRGNPKALESMRQETRRSHSLSHQNIVRLHDLHEVAGEPAFISMEFVEGRNLHELAKERPGKAFSMEKVWRWTRQLAGALAYAHSRGVIHRDLKPANLMLDKAGELKLADFGLAAALRDPAETNDRNISGTPAYMSPQQFGGAPATVADDIYSLGACLFELLAGAPVFAGPDVRKSIEFEPAPWLSAVLKKRGLATEISEPFEDLLLQCLSKAPDQRPKSAAEFLEAATAALEPDKVEGSQARGFWRRVSKRRAMLAGGLAVALLAAGWSTVAHKRSQARFLNLSAAPARASSFLPPSAPKEAFDGAHRHPTIREATRWASSAESETGSEWIAVDLGQDMLIEAVVIDWELAFAKDFTVRTRTSAEGFAEDPAQWKERAKVTGFFEKTWWAVNEILNEEDVTFDFARHEVRLGNWMKAAATDIAREPVIGRHVMIHATAVGPNNTKVYSIYEIDIAAKPAR